MSNQDMLEQLIESQIDSLMESDTYYQMFATPLKPASTIKKAHRNHLIDFFKMTSLRKQLENAPNLILNSIPKYVSPEDFDKIKSELDGSGEHFAKFIESMNDKVGENSNSGEEKPILLQEMLGLSDETLLHVYDLAVEFVKTGNYEGANTLFVFLSTMAPHVTSYWIAQGTCLKAVDLHEEAISAFSVAKFLNPLDPRPSAYTIESYLILKENDNAKLEIEVLKGITGILENEEKKQWEQEIEDFMVSLKE